MAYKDIAGLWDVVAGLRVEAKRAKTSRERLAEQLDHERKERQRLEEELRKHVGQSEGLEERREGADATEDEVLVIFDEDDDDEWQKGGENAECGGEEKKLVANERKRDVWLEVEEQEQVLEERSVYMKDTKTVEEVMSQARIVRPLGRHQQVGEVHLVVGDSIARDFPFKVQEPDRVMNASQGGMTFVQLANEIGEMLADWRSSIRTWEVEGRVVLWLGGNDVYPRRRSHRPRGLRTAAVTAVLRALLNQVPAHTLLVLGPTPRKSDSRWELSLAYHAEATITDIVKNLNESVEVVQHIGRPLADRNHRMTRKDVFRHDGVHLTEQGYRRVAVRMPAYLKVE